MKRIFKQKRSTGLALNYLFLAVMAFFALGPATSLLFNSLKGAAEIGKNPLGFPSKILWENFPNAWEIGNYAKTVPNSLILVAGTICGVLLLGGMAAYSLARLNPRGGGILMLYFLVVSSLPLQLFLVPLFFLWRNLHLINNLFGLIIIYIAIDAPFAIFLLRSYFVQIPTALDDAARIDGANDWLIFRHIVVPLCWPAFLSVGLIVGMGVWNEFLLATTFLTEPELFTVVTSYFNFTARHSRDWGLTSAGATMMVIPLVFLFLLLQRQFIEGLTQGGLKG